MSLINQMIADGSLVIRPQRFRPTNCLPKHPATPYDKAALDAEMDRLGMAPNIWETSGMTDTPCKWSGPAIRLTDKEVPGHLCGDDDFPGKLA